MNKNKFIITVFLINLAKNTNRHNQNKKENMNNLRNTL